MRQKEGVKVRRLRLQTKAPSLSSPLYISLSSLATVLLFLCMTTMMFRPCKAFVTKPIGNYFVTSKSRGLARKARGAQIPSRWMDKIVQAPSSFSSKWGDVLTSLFDGFGQNEIDPGNVRGMRHFV